MRCRIHHDPLSDASGGHAFTDRNDDATAFMTKHLRRCCREQALGDVNISTAYADSFHPDDQLSSARGEVRDVFDS